MVALAIFAATYLVLAIGHFPGFRIDLGWTGLCVEMGRDSWRGCSLASPVHVAGGYAVASMDF